MYLDSNKTLESALRRSNHEIPPDAAFDIAVGDDSHLVREVEAVDAATPYHEYVTDEVADEEGVEHRVHYVQSDEGREKKGAAAKRMWRKRKAKIVEMPPPVQAAERLLTA
jgi:hypothetical protein